MKSPVGTVIDFLRLGMFTVAVRAMVEVREKERDNNTFRTDCGIKGIMRAL